MSNGAMVAQYDAWSQHNATGMSDEESRPDDSLSREFDVSRHPGPDVRQCRDHAQWLPDHAWQPTSMNPARKAIGDNSPHHWYQYDRSDLLIGSVTVTA